MNSETGLKRGGKSSPFFVPSENRVTGAWFGKTYSYARKTPQAHSECGSATANITAGISPQNILWKETLRDREDIQTFKAV